MCVQVRSWLTALKKLSLLQGSMDDGFTTHDIVREYAIAQSGDGLPGLQHAFLDAVVAARPEPDGWPLRDGLPRGTLEWYVAVYAEAHVRGAISSAMEPSATDLELLWLLIEDSRGLGEARGSAHIPTSIHDVR